MQYPLIEDTKALEDILNGYNEKFHQEYEKMMKSKLGLTTENENDKNLIKELESNLHLSETDMTLFYRNLSNITKDSSLDDNDAFLRPLIDSFYKPDEVIGNVLERWRGWFKNYINRLQTEAFTDSERKLAMNKVNPKYVLRNYMSQLAIEAADIGDYSVIEELYTMLKSPYDEQPKYEKWFAKRPEWARNKVGCSMLSCSS
jgi:uncharacterized protein YdiU (UPF0061 family)